MNLLEPLVAGVVLFIALFSSLQINASNSQWSLDQARSQESRSAADASLLASQAIASNLAQAQSSGSVSAMATCNQAAVTLAQNINAASLGTIGDVPVQREATVITGDLVDVTVTADNLAPRQRWLSPAAYGLCGGSSTPP
jgi:phage terminase Nu1 subunit (DNA packaging protein)